jgi:hypothetical protein
MNVYPYQSSHRYLQPYFFFDLTHYRLRWCFAPLDSAAGQIPEVYITSMTEQDAALLIQDNAERSYFDSTPGPLFKARIASL